MGLFSDSAPRLPSNTIQLAAGQVFVPAAGWYYFKPGRVCNVQRYDPVGELWRYAGDELAAFNSFYFDGTNVRIANTSGCVVGVQLTTAGSGYTTPPTVTAAAGSAVFQAIVGGAVSTAATIAVAGSGYTYPPLLWIEQPPQPGIQATGYTTISSGTISAVTITQQGAGYIFPPNVAVINDFRDTAGSGGQVTVALTGSGTVTGVLVTNHGNPITSGTVPALTFSSGSAAGTAIMNWGVQSVSISAAGAGYTSAAATVNATGTGGYITTTPSYLGAESAVSLERYRPATLVVSTNSSGGLVTPVAIVDPGQYQSVPTPAIDAAAQNYSTVGTLTFVMGGNPGAFYLSPAQVGQQ
jgi:hypothetical protein